MSDYKNEMREVRRKATWSVKLWLPFGLLILIILLVIGWIIQGNDFFIYKAFAPQRVQVETDTFKNSQAYIDGMVQELQQYMLDYNKSDVAHQVALKTVIIRQSAKVDEKYLPEDLKIFINKLKLEQ